MTTELPELTFSFTGRNDYRFRTLPPHAIEVRDVENGGRLVVRCHFDGRVEFGEGITPDAAAREFWHRMGHHAPKPAALAEPDAGAVDAWTLVAIDDADAVSLVTGAGRDSLAAAVREAVFAGDSSDHDDEVDGIADELLTRGVMHFEGDRPLYLHRALAASATPSRLAEWEADCGRCAGAGCAECATPSPDHVADAGKLVATLSRTDHSTAMEGWNGALNDISEIANNATDARIINRARRVQRYIAEHKPSRTDPPADGREAVAEVIDEGAGKRLRVHDDAGLSSLLRFPVGTKFYTAPPPQPTQPEGVADESEDEYVIRRLSTLLAEIAVIVNGPEPPLTRWSYHDLSDKVRALAARTQPDGGAR